MKETDQLKKLTESLSGLEEGRHNDPVAHIHKLAAKVAGHIRELAKESDSFSNRALFGDMVEELGKDFVEALELELNMVFRK